MSDPKGPEESEAKAYEKQMAVYVTAVHAFRMARIKEGRYKCQYPNCSVEGMWNRKPLPLFVISANGQLKGDPENYMLMCGNCTQQWYKKLKRTAPPNVPLEDAAAELIRKQSKKIRIGLI